MITVASIIGRDCTSVMKVLARVSRRREWPASCEPSRSRLYLESPRGRTLGDVRRGGKYRGRASGLSNGEFVPYEAARIPVEDRGLQFADGVYEVVRYYDGRPFRMQQHLARLVRSAAGIELPLPPIEEIRQAMDALVERQGLRDATVYLQVTRG